MDDEQDIIDILHEHFAKKCDVETAAVIFLDINMPGINGVDVLKSVKEIDATIPVLMIAANADNALAAEAIKRGAFSYVPKPCSRAGRNR